MSFREKSAWVTLILEIITMGVFVSLLPWPLTLAPEASPILFWRLVWLIAIFIAVEIIAHIVMAIFSPRDAQAPKDERELLIELRSARVGGFVYTLLSLALVFTALHAVPSNVLGVAYLLLLAFVLSEIVKYVVRVWYYRFGF